jgi:hypothetical protein
VRAGRVMPCIHLIKVSADAAGGARAASRAETVAAVPPPGGWRAREDSGERAGHHDAGIPRGRRAATAPGAR